MNNPPRVTRTWAILQISGPKLDPEKVTSLLGIDPSDSAKPEDAQGAYRRGQWSLSSQEALASRDLEEHIAWVLDQIEPASGKLNGLLVRGDVRGDLSCFWETEATQEGQAARLIFSPDLLGRIASFGFVLDINTYVAS